MRAETGGDFLRQRNGARIGERAIVQPGTGNDIRDQPSIGGGEPRTHQRAIDGLKISQRHMRQDDVLLVADADFIEGIFRSNVGDEFHLLVGRIAGNTADRLQRDRHHAVIGMLVRRDVLLDETGKAFVRPLPARQTFPAFGTILQCRRREIGGDGRDISIRQLQFAVFQFRELDLDLASQAPQHPSRARGS